MKDVTKQKIYEIRIEKINNKGFAPLAPLQKSKATYTLHNVIRDALGMADHQEVNIGKLASVNSLDMQETEQHVTADNADVAY